MISSHSTNLPDLTTWLWLVISMRGTLPSPSPKASSFFHVTPLLSLVSAFRTKHWLKFLLLFSFRLTEKCAPFSFFGMGALLRKLQIWKLTWGRSCGSLAMKFSLWELKAQNWQLPRSETTIGELWWILTSEPAFMISWKGSSRLSSSRKGSFFWNNS